MKHILVFVFLLGTVLFADSLNSKTIEPKNITTVKEIDILDMRDDNLDSRFGDPAYDSTMYVGLAFGRVKANSATGTAVTLSGGLQFSDYSSIEARYTTMISDIEKNGSVSDIDIDNISIFIKQTLPISSYLVPYALLGYGSSSYAEERDSSLVWGVGFHYTYHTALAFFVDYVSYYNDDFNKKFKEDIEISSFNLGTTYTF